eukprot:CAMPEP_0194355380 /NCGR_PEP_ID=MMETSP0174-20130528/3301_1 /TAXON_ID=216777 /ORGANISM="Proboscia alata, Strain PI-D3" /LENGTH=222 /DNA_ID=CAMNT_0039124635 /DNA_START=15 /DNA_END=683 /DNA_ORIENTATION=+
MKKEDGVTPKVTNNEDGHIAEEKSDNHNDSLLNVTKSCAPTKIREITTTIKQRPKLYLIIANISKPSNIKKLLLSSFAFGCRTVFVAGQKKFDFDGNNNDLPQSLRNLLPSVRLKIVQFEKLSDCIHHVKHVMGARVCGVEIVEDAQDVQNDPFEINSDGNGDTAIMMGNEGSGMNRRQLESCDYFVRISQFGSGTASLNVYVAASIVMHRFHHWSREYVKS